ncbi:motility associated factor glycosyltransferase family protein [Pelosinus fermentans]|uniref:DUF115 domain-containing protein n=1 Tax=Pelosinus fermentans JBW45 TaxID=1192197 RepID=I9NNQ8_9FIRM|nr:6-hydroxymethylpterin diphosphokinase MptE-like protein [Pelosinus fermentans]AJQ26080.1 protein of unknown function DUF115 [Pelosinus fermentans JBW45]
MIQETKNEWATKNWAAYKERYNSIDFDRSSRQERIEIKESRAGVPTVRVMSSNGKWIFLHSSIDPVKEAQKIADSVSSDPGKIIVIYGFALGYLVEALLETTDKRNLLFIIEPDYDLFCAAMAARDLHHIIDSERVHVLVSNLPGEIRTNFFLLYDETKYDDIVMTGLSGHQTVYPTTYHELVPLIKDAVDAKLFNLVTMIKIGPDAAKNALLNMVDYCTHPGVSSLYGRLAGVPAIIVSAGPSLNKNIHLLKAAKGKAVILAVGTALKALKKWDIEPDFVFSIDPQDLNYELHFKGLNTEKVALVSEIQANHMIVANHQGPIFVSGDMPIVKWFGEGIESKGKLESGGSVANNAFAAAYKMGANPIILVGQDLAYSREGHSHAAGTNYENQVYSLDENSEFFPVKANDGGYILTDRSFHQFLLFFQIWIETYPEREYINATEGGAFIQGTKLMTLQEVLDQHCQNAVDVEKIIKEAQVDFNIPNMEPILETIKLRLKDTNNMIAEANKAIRYLSQLERACESRQAKKMQQYLKAVNKITGKFEKDQYICEVAEWFVRNDVHKVMTRTHKAVRSENDEYSNAIADYTLYYKKIIEGLKAIKDLLQQCMEKIGSDIDNGK